MSRNAANRPAFAWVVSPPDAATGSRVRAKDGGVPGVSSGVLVNPKRQFGLVLLTNMLKVHAIQAGHAIMGELLALSSAR